MAETPRHDLFISYAEADRGWVEGYLLDALTAAEVAMHSEAAFELGRPRLLAFEEAVRLSRRTLLVISSAYLADEAAVFVDLLAQTYGFETATWPVIPLVIEPVTLPPRLALLTRLEATDPAGWASAVQRLFADIGRPVPPPEAPPPCPYPGMRPFGVTDAPVFHGREAETEDLLHRLHAQVDRAHRFVAVIGPSGSGKSSLVFAGLIPALQASALFGSGSWAVLSLRPGPTPMESATAVIGDDSSAAGPTLAEMLAAPPAGRVLLVVDQFEELFTTAASEQVEPFQEAIVRLAATPGCFVVLTARADFYEDLMASPLWPLIGANRFEVLPLDEAGLRRAIVNPADRVGVHVEATLVERLAADAAGEPGVLPLVQQTLVLLWERLERRFLPLRAYEALVLPRAAYGGADGATLTGLQVAVARHADAAMAELMPEQQAIARRIFVGLVQPNEGRADTRRQRSIDELRSVGDDADRFEAVVQHLAANRLLTLSGAEEGGARRVDLAHEALIDGWPWLHELVGTHRDATQTRQRLDSKVADWERLGRGEGGLLDAVELAEAEQWLASPDAAVLGYGAGLPALVAASRAELAREERRLRRRLYGAVAFAAVALIAAIVALSFFQRAETESRRARDNEALALSNEALAEQRAAEAADSAGTAEAERRNADAQAAAAATSEAQAEEDAAAAATAQAQAETNADLAEAERRNAEEQAMAAATAEARAETSANRAEAEAAAAAASEATAVAAQATAEWRADVSRAQALAGQAPRQHEVGEDERGALLARQGYLFDHASGGEVHAQVDESLRAVLDRQYFSVSLQHEEVAWAVAFSSDGRWLATGSWDGSLRLWDLTLPYDPPIVLPGDEDSVNALAFSPDGSILATGGDDATVRIWDMTQLDADPRVLPGHDGPIHAVAFHSNGTTLATGGADGTVRVWDLEQPDGDPHVFRHGDIVLAVAFAPDGSTLATGSGVPVSPELPIRVTGGTDGKVRLWDLEQREAESVLLHQDAMAVNAVTYSPDGATLAIGTEFGDVRLWDVAGAGTEPVPLGDHDMVLSLAFSRDGTRLAVASGGDSTVRIWDMARRAAPPVILEHAGVGAVAFSADGTKLASGSLDSTVRLWHLTRPAAAPVMLAHDDQVLAVAFSANGATLATGSNDGTVWLWDTARLDAIPRVLRGHDGSVYTVALHRNGSLLASGGIDGTVRVWDLEQPGGDPRIVGTHREPVDAVAFSPDGSLLASGSWDGTIQIWSTLRLGDPLLVLPDRDDIYAIAFSPDGRSLAAGGLDRTVRIWDLASGTETRFSTPHGDAIYAIAFSPDGSRLASGGLDRVVLLWDTARPDAEPRTLPHDDIVMAVDFSRRGGTLATASSDGTARLWDVSRPDAGPVILRGHDGWVAAVAFHPNGGVLATGSDDATARVWIAETNRLAAQVCLQVRRNLTMEEWRQFVGEDVPYQRTCLNLPPGEGAPPDGATPSPSPLGALLLPPRATPVASPTSVEDAS